MLKPRKCDLTHSIDFDAIWGLDNSVSSLIYTLMIVYISTRNNKKITNLMNSYVYSLFRTVFFFIASEYIFFNSHCVEM